VGIPANCPKWARW